VDNLAQVFGEALPVGDVPAEAFKERVNKINPGQGFVVGNSLVIGQIIS
jgi:hypothetical protein